LNTYLRLDQKFRSIFKLFRQNGWKGQLFSFLTADHAGAENKLFKDNKYNVKFRPKGFNLIP
jgi:hypothetical protein